MRHIYTILLFVTFSGVIFSQTDSHYWSNQFGAHGLLLNGAVISSAHDETSIFYNPGAIPLHGNLGFAFSFISPTYANLSNKNFLGNNQRLSDSGFGFSPGFLAVRFKPFKTDKIVAGVATFERFESDINFDDRVVDKVDMENLFVFRSDLNFKRRKSENWYGVALGYKINENLGIGFSQFSVWHGENLELDFTKEILVSSNPTNVVQSWRSAFDYDLSVYSGWITKFGMSYCDEIIGLGLTVTTPLYGGIRSGASYAIDDQRINNIDTTISVVSNREDLDEAVYKSPLSIGLGFDCKLGKYRIYTSAEYFRPIDMYTLFSDSGDTFDGIATTESNFDIGVVTGNEAVLNFAVGFEYFRNDRITLLGGFRTDFNESNNLMINESTEYLSTTPNVFHVSGGVLATYGKNIFSLGADIGYGRSQNGQQLTDLSNITNENIFTFSGDDTVNSEYFSFSIFLTYDFIFQRIADAQNHRH
ncbi:hypothetical protein N9L92_04210 [Saprospiraceae bacterium]|nr:hypothetical protein [Saprospiraceae bacterium]